MLYNSILRSVVALAFGLLCGGTGALANESDVANKEAATETAPSLGIGSPAESWLIYRGDAMCSGVSQGKLPEEMELLWKKEIPGGAIEATAIIAGDTVYVGDLDGALYARDLATGDERWTKKMEAGFLGAAAFRNDILYLGDMDGFFHALKATDGTPVWKAETGSEINSAPGFHKDNVLIGSQDGYLYCFNAATGAETWKYNIENMIQCSVSMSDGKVFLAGCDGVLHVVDAETGSAVVKVPIQSETKSTPMVHGDLALFGTYRETVVCVDWKKGETRWVYQNPKKRFPFSSSAALFQEWAVIGGEDKFLHAIDLATGKDVWTFPTRGKIESSPVIVSGVAYFGAADGKVYGVDAKTGEKRWEYEAGGKFVASPAVASGKLVIGNQSDGTLYCFGEKQK